HAAMVQNPGLVFHGCDDLRVLQGVILDGAPPTLRFGAGKAIKQDGVFRAQAEVRSRRPDGREVLHARADILLASTLPAAPSARSLGGLEPYPLKPSETYRQGLLFHGPGMQGIEMIEGIAETGIAGVSRSAPPASEWMRQPLRQGWLADPQVLDTAFQMGILWTLEERGMGSLPVRLGRYRQYRKNFPADGEIRVLFFLERAGDMHAVASIDFIDAQGKLLARLDEYECVLDAKLSRAFRRNIPTTA
ncbi:MAG: polyketide synthase dehydratase domain-containing protein, partial [Gemmataceae bacterium]